MIIYVVNLQAELEYNAYEKVRHISEEYSYKNDSKKKKTTGPEISERITERCKEHTKHVLTQWWKLAKQLIFKYNLGCIITEEGKMTNIEYPEWWLKEVGYFNGPISYQKDIAAQRD